MKMRQPAVSNTHKVGVPVMLTDRDIAERRERLTAKYGDAATLRRKKARGFISTDELLALSRHEDLDYLEDNQ